MPRIGWATRDITPTRPAMLQGQMHRRIASSAMDPLTVTAMAIEGERPQDAVIFVSCDLPFISPEMTTKSRAILAAKGMPFPPEAVIMHATHTHDAMVTEDGFYEYPGGDVMTPTEGTDWVVKGVVEAAVEAWETRKPRTLGRAFGHAVVGHNRHAVYADGHAEMYGRTNREDFTHFGGYEDHSVDMLFTWDADGNLAGVAVAIPCPSQATEQLEQFSADFWHEARVELRRRLGKHLQVLPMCSAAGDQSPHFLLYGPQEEEMRKRRGVTERQEIANRIADAVQKALECTKPEPARQWPLTHRVHQMALTPRQISRAERDQAEKLRQQWIAKNSPKGWWPVRLQQVVDCFDGVAKAEPMATEIHVVRLGDVGIATNPFELFIDYSMQIKARSNAPQTMVIQLAGRGMYLPSARAVQGGGYGAMPAVSSVGPEGGQELVAQTLATLGELFPPQPKK